MLIRILIFYLVAATATLNARDDIKIQDKQISKSHIDYQLRNNANPQIVNLDVTIPSKLWNIWYQLVSNVNYEVGGGVDFAVNREIRRIKLSYGAKKSIAFIPDFELAWHTHPGVDKTQQQQKFLPPSSNDMLIAVIGAYNLWVFINELPVERIINLKSFDVERPYMVSANIVVDRSGAYIFKVDKQFWQQQWHDPIAAKKSIAKLKPLLDDVIANAQDYLYVQEQSISQVHDYMFNKLKEFAGINMLFYPWQELLSNGVDVELQILE